MNIFIFLYFVMRRFFFRLYQSAALIKRYAFILVWRDRFQAAVYLFPVLLAESHLTAAFPEKFWHALGQLIIFFSARSGLHVYAWHA